MPLAVLFWGDLCAAQGSFLTSSDILAVQQSSGFKMERFQDL